MRNFNDNKSGRNQMHDAVCSECGNNCKVPFKPSSGKPIYCSNCFEKRSGNRFEEKDSSRSRYGSRNSDRNQMHDAVCAECGANCKIPFMPKTDKPIYCSDCFEKRGNGGRNSRGSNFTSKKNYSAKNYKRDFENLNAKLDMILKALAPKEEVEIEEVKVKKVAKKKAKAKKTTKTKKTKAKKVKEAEVEETETEVVAE